jgi:hypothetical protein
MPLLLKRIKLINKYYNGLENIFILFGSDYLLTTPLTLTTAFWPITGGSGNKVVELNWMGEFGGEQLVKVAVE